MADEPLAVAVSYNPQTGECLATPFRCKDAMKMAAAFGQSLRDEGGEWAECLWGVLYNEKAVVERVDDMFSG